MNLVDFNRYFIWTPDGRIDNWKIIKDFPLRGDCEDYAATVLWIESDESILKWWWKVLTLQAIFWVVKDYNGNNHCVLWLKDKGWIDSQNKFWHKNTFPDRKYPVIAPALLIKLLLGKIM